MTPSTYRCSNCAINWPYTRDYRQCPACKDACSHMQDESIDEAEAEGIVKRIRFEEFCAKRDAAALKATASEIAKLPEAPASVRRPLYMRWDRGFE